MLTKSTLTDLATHTFPTAKDYEEFLEEHHKTSPGIYVKMAKKASGITSITGPEAVEVALCFGWIDGRANSIDDKWWCIRHTPRRPKSIWSQKNVQTIARLQEQGKLRAAGIEAVEAAKADGRWDRAYAGPATITVPDDFAKVLDGNAAAKETFEGMNKSERYTVLWKIETASVKARAGRINTAIELLANSKTSNSASKATSKAIPKATPKSAAKRKMHASERINNKIPKTIKPEEESRDETIVLSHSRRSGLRRNPGR